MSRTHWLVAAALLSSCATTPHVPAYMHCALRTDIAHQWTFASKDAREVWVDPVAGRAGFTVVDTAGQLHNVDSKYVRCLPLGVAINSGEPVT